MEYPLVWLKVAGLVLMWSGLAVSVFYHQAARIAASASAGAAATAVARFLGEAAADPSAPWTCEEDLVWWPRAEELAAVVAVGRARSVERVLPTGVELELDESCAVVVSVVATVAGVWSALSARAVGCAETVEHVLTVPPPCRTVSLD